MADYYTSTSDPADNTDAEPLVLRTEHASIQAGFAKVAAYTGNADKIVAINSAGTAQEAITTTGTGSGVRATSPTLVTPLLGTPTSGVLTNCTGYLASSLATPTADLPMGTYKHTGVGNGSARTDYAAVGQAQDGSFIWCGTAGGTANALTLTPAPAITAYAAGQEFIFKSGASPNSSAVTIAVSGLTTKAAQANGSALAGGEIAANQWYKILYDGAAFQITPYTGVLSVANGGTGSTTAPAARTSLGLVIGTDVQAYDVDTAKLDVAQSWTAVQSFAAGANIASAATIDLTAATGNSPRITGTVATSAVTMNTGQQMLVVADGAWPLTYHATTNKLNSAGANVTLAAGDMVLYSKDLSGVVHGNIIKADGTAVVDSAKIVQIVNTQTGAVATGTTTIPFDDTVPQNTEGDQYLSLAITPTNAANLLRIEVEWVGSNSAVGGMTLALFQDATASALAATHQRMDQTGGIYPIGMSHYMTAGTTSATTFKIRAGLNNAGTTAMNGNPTRQFGGALASSITITEITA